ncbi:MAG: glycosyltransferase [Phycisphaerae bacterium]
MTIWTGLGGLLGLIWLLRLLAMFLVYRRRQVLGAAMPYSLPAPAPRLSVVVAAKDEEANIETCVRSLMQQDYPDFQLIAVNDRSDDRTPEILDALKLEFHDKLQVIHVESLQEGWFGKNNAMREGIELADGDWLCMTDADCEFQSPRTLSLAVDHALERGSDFLSIAPILITKCWWERVLQPVCGAVLIVWFLPERVNSPKYKTAYANGAFMLMNRRCYEGIGGHAAFKTQVNEDIHMAKAAKLSGFNLRVVENDGLYTTRMYTSLRQAIRGWSRILYGSIASPIKLSIAALVVIVFSVLPWVGFGFSLFSYLNQADGVPSWLRSTQVWGLACALQLGVMALFYPILRIPAVWALTYPIGALGAVGILFRAILQSLGAATTTWRGTTYRGDQLESKHAAAPHAMAQRVVAPTTGHGESGSTAAVDDVVTSPADGGSGRL